MNKLMTVILLLILGTGLLALPPQLTASGNPKLHKTLAGKAHKNLKLLPASSRDDYMQLLKQHPDILMAYLIAYESDANLAAATPVDVKCNYREIVKLLEKDGLQYSPEFFLSYVAKQTVSDEAITPYRNALLEDGLQQVLDNNPTPLERFRATTLWCVSRLQFQQTSGRDQTPLDITQKSLTGRCEEMQILFVAAARVVGLPSRPASAPWWAHMDNNHAWAEVWLDGAWHYTGDMDAAWFPDQTWFSGMIDKTVLILADGSLAAEDDEILNTGTYDTLINSTRNYAKERTRMVKLSVVDEKGKAVKGARVSPMVFNWGSLRALVSLATDKQGKLQFSCGRGAFYLSVFKGGKKALHYVPSSAEEVVELKLTVSKADFASEDKTMEYPSNPMEWDNQPDAYREAVQREKELWNNKLAEYKTQVSQWLSAEKDSLAYEVAIACKGNWRALQGFMKRAGDVEDGYWEFLLNYDPKFLWQANSGQFEALHRFYRDQAPHLNGGDEEQVLLSPTVYYEELPQPAAYMDGKALLYPDYFYVQGGSTHEKVEKVMTILHQRHKVKAKKALSGLIPLHIAIQQRYLTAYQFRLLACSMLRANGIPADFSRLPDFITVYLNEDWEYYNVTKREWDDRSGSSTGDNLKLSVRIEDETGIPIQVSEEQLSLCRYVEGMFYPLSHRFDYQGNGVHSGLFNAEDAYLQFGYRSSDSQTGFHLAKVADNSTDSLSYVFVARHYPRTWKAAEEDILALLDAEVLEMQSVILIGNYDQENSRRLADKLVATGNGFMWIGYQADMNAPANYRTLTTWQQAVQDNSRNAMRSITLIKKEGAWQMFEGLWDKLP